MKKLYMVEGIPGSGKTTFAKKLADRLQEKNDCVSLYTECDLHPTDLAWCAVLNQSEYKSLLNDYPEFSFEIMKNSSVCKNYYVVAYTKIQNIPAELYGYLESKEIYDGRVSTETFCNLNETRWKLFGQTTQNISVFECAFLQNSINELLLFGCMPKDRILSYLETLLNDVSSLMPEVIYLDAQTDKTLEKAAKERVDINNNRVWEQQVSLYIENSPFGKMMGWSGKNSMQSYFSYRKELELDILERLTVKKQIIRIDLAKQDEIINDWINQKIG